MQEREREFAIIIAAKNEEKVIKYIINSLKKQKYNKDLFEIYVVADNCTDGTAKLARAHGAQVIERFNNDKKGANFAIQYALKYILDFKKYDAYCYFDADNIIDENWLSEVNKTLNEGYDLVTTYRNSINLKDNWISAAYGIQFIKESRFVNFGRSKLGMTSFVNGTGFCFTNKLVEMTDGWNFNSLSHDIEFTQFLSLKNIKCGYANDAIFYDEQPTKFKDSYKQRLRWSKGFLEVFKIYGKKEFKSIFSRNKMNKKSVIANFFVIFPQIFLFFINFLFYIVLSILIAFEPKNEYSNLFIIPLQYWVLTPVFILLGLYLNYLLFSIIVVIKERKRINSKFIKALLYAFLYPIFMSTYIPISIIALFKKKKTSGWDPIVRKDRE